LQVEMSSVNPGEYWSLWTGNTFNPSQSSTWSNTSFPTQLVNNSALNFTPVTLSNLGKYIMIKATGSPTSDVLLNKLIISATSTTTTTVTFDFSDVVGTFGPTKVYNQSGQSVT